MKQIFRYRYQILKQALENAIGEEVTIGNTVGDKVKFHSKSTKGIVSLEDPATIYKFEAVRGATFKYESYYATFNPVDREAIHKAKRLELILNLSSSGYGGINAAYNEIQDRRFNPDAIPLQHNPFFNIPPAKELKEWYSIEEAPRDGTAIVGRDKDSSSYFYCEWEENRQHPASSTSAGAGWVDSHEARLPIDAPFEWHPIGRINTKVKAKPPFVWGTSHSIATELMLRVGGSENPKQSAMFDEYRRKIIEAVEELATTGFNWDIDLVDKVAQGAKEGILEHLDENAALLKVVSLLTYYIAELNHRGK